MARANALAEAVDIAVEMCAALPASERAEIVKESLELKQLALAPEPPFARVVSLAYLEDEFEGSSPQP